MDRESSQKLLEEDAEATPRAQRFTKRLLLSLGAVLLVSLGFVAYFLSTQPDDEPVIPVEARPSIVKAVISAVAITTTAAVAPPSPTPEPQGKPLLPKSTLSQLSVYPPSPYRWISNDQAKDGTYVSLDGDEFVLNHVEDNTQTVLGNRRDILDSEGNLIHFSDWSISADLRTILVSTNVESGWRHSFFADYYVVNLETKKARPLPFYESDKKIPNVLGSGKVAFAQFGPAGSEIIWVRDNDLYVNMGDVEFQVTIDGSKNIINGICDWVYEEEVLASKQAAWFSTDGRNVAYIKFNDTNVQEYLLQYYAKFGETSYPKQINIKYPKPGTPNPVAQLFIAHLNAQRTRMESVPIDFGALDFGEERIITEVDWISSTALLVRIMNRVQDSQRLFLVYFDGKRWISEMVRNETTPDGAWHNRLQPLYLIGKDKNSFHHYIEIMDNEEGFAHLAYFDALNQHTPTHWITKGEWEVVDYYGFDQSQDLVYFSSTKFGSSQRHIFSVKIDGSEMRLVSPPSSVEVLSVVPRLGMEAGTPLGTAGFFSADFSPRFNYFQLSYLGPDVPWSRLEKVHDPDFGYFLMESELQKSFFHQYEVPLVKYLTIKNENGDGRMR
jgi:hypothetical protein